MPEVGPSLEKREIKMDLNSMVEGILDSIPLGEEHIFKLGRGGETEQEIRTDLEKLANLFIEVERRWSDVPAALKPELRRAHEKLIRETLYLAERLNLKPAETTEVLKNLNLGS